MTSRSRFLAALAILTLGASLLLTSPANAGNPDPNGPSVQITTHPNLRSSASQVTFNFVGTSTEDMTFKCSLTGQPDITNCPSGIVYTSDKLPTEGEYTFTVEVTDQSARTATDSFTWVVDRTPPTLTINSGPLESSVSMTNTPTYTWTNAGAAPTNDAITNSCTIDEKDIADCSSPLKLGPLSAGPHVFVLRASDSAGNPAPAQTRDFKVAGTCNIALQSRVVIRSPKATALARLAPNCATNDRKAAAWSVKNPAGAASSTLTFATSAITTSWTLPDSARLGTYTARGTGATDASGDPMVQGTSTTLVRLGSRASLKATRSGRKVTLTVGTSTYAPAANRFTTTGKRAVVLQYRTCAACAWKTLKKVRTGTSGKVSFTYTQKSARFYRAVTSNTATVWGVTSATVHR